MAGHVQAAEDQPQRRQHQQRDGDHFHVRRQTGNESVLLAGEFKRECSEPLPSTKPRIKRRVPANVDGSPEPSQQTAQESRPTFRYRNAVAMPMRTATAATAINDQLDGIELLQTSQMLS